MRWFTRTVLCLTALVIAGCIRIQAAPAPARLPPADISTEDLLNYSVVSGDGQPIGPVHGVVMHISSGGVQYGVQYVVVLLPDKYHFGKGAYGPPNNKFLLIPWSHLKLDATHQVLVADVDRANLVQAPVLNRVPDTSPPDWDATIAQYWATR